MESLPPELVREILLLLPAITLVVAHYVCRLWRTLIRDPCFAREHLSSAVGGNGGYLVQHSRDRKVSTVRRENLLTYVHDIDTLHRGMRSAFVPLCRKLPYFNRIDQSCDGLVLLVDDSRRRSSSGLSERLVHICNPLLGRWITLPEETYDRRIVQSTFTRLAFDATSGKYKVFRVTWLRQKQIGSFLVLCDVMLVGTGRDSPAGDGWRRAGTVQLTEFCPHEIVVSPTFRNGILSGGELHWVVWKDNRLPAVMSIDVRSERIDFSSNLGIKNHRIFGCCPLTINGRLCLASLQHNPILNKDMVCFYGRRRESSPAATADHPSFERLIIYDCLLDYCSSVIATSSSNVHKMGALLFCDTKQEYPSRHLQRDLRTNMIRRLRTPKYSGYEEIGLIEYTPSLLVPTI